MNLWNLRYNTALAAASGQWQVALRIFHELDGGRLEMDAISFNSSIKACQARWPWCLVILELSKPSLVTISEAALGAPPIAMVRLLHELEDMALEQQKSGFLGRFWVVRGGLQPILLGRDLKNLQ